MAVAGSKRSPTPEPRRNVVAAARSSGRRTSSSAARWEFVRSIIGAILIFLVVRTFLVEAYRIPSGSMIPTLLVGDWLFVNKLIYGPNIPFTSINLPGYAEPGRGEVAVFVSPRQADQPWDPTPTLVKRIAGAPGDTLYMRSGELFANGVVQRPVPGTERNPRLNGDVADPLMLWQRQYALSESRFGPAPERPTLDDWGPIVIPDERYFMLGDNRHQSKDSRYWGLVPRENFRGRPIFVYYSYQAEQSDRPLPFLTDIRWGRIGHRIR
ncbi:MAG TPA: signal peptidase I [Gemmatimonadaceae bacterium]|nr:signal peptidase I [Gemmatimonadaceae bacterium]